MKITSKIVTLILTLSLVFGLQNKVFATYSYTGKTFYRTESGTVYAYKIYLDGPENWYIMFNLPVCDPVYHISGHGTTTLTYSRSASYTGTSSYSFSTSLGATADAGLVNMTVSATNGLSYSSSMSVQATGMVGRTLPSNASTGYYKLSICHNFYPYLLKKYNANSNMSYVSECKADLPKGEPYVACLYTANNDQSGYHIY